MKKWIPMKFCVCVCVCIYIYIYILNEITSNVFKNIQECVKRLFLKKYPKIIHPFFCIFDTLNPNSPSYVLNLTLKNEIIC